MTLKFIIILVVLIILICLNIKVREGFDNSKNNIDNSNLNIIIPVRDREKDLKEYLENMVPILEEQNINYKIFIIEQSHNKKLFNKAKINNIGFIESSKNNNFNRFLFNDVDNFPLKKKFIDFKMDIRGVHHFFGQVYCIGGIYLFSKNDYKKINGFSNDFYGWGGEDEDLLFRINNFSIKILRDVFVSRKDNKKLKIISDDSTMWKHRQKKENLKDFLNNKRNMYKKNKNNVFKDGINTCSYKIIKKYKNYNDNQNIMRILVDI
jgi:hypothetical protein